MAAHEAVAEGLQEPPEGLPEGGEPVKNARAASPAAEEEGGAPATGEPTGKKARRAASAGGAEGGEAPKAAAGGGEEAAAAASGVAGAEDAAAPAKAGEADVIEEGRIQFFYRPKVEKQEVGGLGDVQRFFMLLRPERPGAKARLCVVGKKRLPSARRHERFFGFVEAVSEDAETLLEGLGEQSYETKTRGTRHVGAARAVGQGTYGIVSHKDHVNLVYKLEVPAEPGEAQLEFTIGTMGSFVFAVKNPAGRGPADPGLEEKAEYSEEKQQQFQGYSWIPVHDPQLLEYERCEFLLIGAAEDEGVIQELGEAKQEQVAEASRRHTKSACGAESDEECLLERMKEEVQADKLGLVTEPAETGQLV
ncbi:Apurinic endonuclease-redox [Micractinium conductrix]|uniref:Apurinic endonuclease-redox n=1 Tax=Micractinium conductrix TaxID=554055 RepID=A0A2P6V1X2_9CHLO|nr:Apurinic endonuclease-redox [Micractinium conductrix]|eukprot:PSC68044.1 Apurinic endonuclease-redox [Micractinium conductrix]